MSNKTELKTIEKLKKLNAVIGETENSTSVNSGRETSRPENKGQEKSKFFHDTNNTFKTSEVVVIVIITIIISLAMGGIFVYKLFGVYSGHKVESELQDFIDNYQYIIDNYNGEIDKEEMLDAALEGMLGTLDKNSTYLDADSTSNFNIYLEGSYEGMGIEVYNDEEDNIVINQVFANSSADKAGLQAGDIITKLNGENVKGLTTTKFKNRLSKIDGDIIITYLRDDKEQNAKVSVDKINLQSVTSKTFSRNGQKVGYIYVSIFASNTYKQFKDKLEDLQNENIDSLIIDLRSNSGGYLSVAGNILSLFLDSSHPIYQIQKDGNSVKYYSEGSKTLKLDIAVLVNSGSASASEIVTSALKEQYGATVIGQTTYGKGTVQELQSLPNGDKYKLTTKNWLTSKGIWVDQKGITPDIVVGLSEEYAKNKTDDNDNQLQTAIDELTK